MIVRALTFEKYHNRKNTGSTKIRIHNLIKYWPEFDIYKYGENPDVLIFQKVYIQPDWDWPEKLDCIKILDICDPDWLESENVKQTIDAMDAVTVPTEALKEFIEQMTDKPVRVIKDRFDLEEYPKKPKTHLGKAKNLVWFGYPQNTKKLKGAVNAIMDLDLHLTIISGKDPNFMQWPECVSFKKENYKFLEFKPDEINYELTKHDIAILPAGNEPRDRFKSENKDIIANLCGLPVVKTREELEEMLDPKARNKEVRKKHAYAKSAYDCKISITEYKDLIGEIKAKRN